MAEEGGLGGLGGLGSVSGREESVCQQERGEVRVWGNRSRLHPCPSELQPPRGMLGNRADFKGHGAEGHPWL